MKSKLPMALYAVFLAGVLQFLPPAEVPVLAGRCCISDCDANYQACVPACPHGDEECYALCESNFWCCIDGFMSGVPGCIGPPCTWSC